MERFRGQDEGARKEVAKKLARVIHKGLTRLTQVAKITHNDIFHPQDPNVIHNVFIDDAGGGVQFIDFGMAQKIDYYIQGAECDRDDIYHALKKMLNVLDDSDSESDLD